LFYYYKKHPDFDAALFYNDIAILKLASEVTLNSNIQLACLPTRTQAGSYRNGTRAFAMGWGAEITNGYPAEKLRNVKLTLYDPFYCERSYETVRYDWNRHICAGDLQYGKDTCHG
jgi:hypothetical protein